MHFSWSGLGWLALGLLGALLACGGIDCLYTGLRDMRRGQREFDLRVGLYTALTGLGLLLLGALALWGYYKGR